MEATGLCHMVAVPYPGRGHINPMMTLCHQLLAARAAGGVLITFVVTEEWLTILTTPVGPDDEPPPPPPPGVRLRAIPNVIPSEFSRAANFAAFLEAVFTKMEAPFERLLDELDLPLAAIVADTHLPWAVAVGNRRGIPVASLYTLSASIFSVYYHFDWLPAAGGDNNRQEVGVSGSTSTAKEDLLEHYIPHVTSLTLADISSLLSPGKPLECALQSFSFIRKAQFLLFTSLYELEAHVIDELRLELSCPVYPVGPCIPYMMLQDKPSKAIPLNSTAPDYFKWLDSKAKGSVLYISFGSFLSVSPAQLEEIAMGLLASETKFLWVARGDSSKVKDMCGEMGFVVPWCDQLGVLSHPSIGAFLTHCGWNSTLEAIFAGVPMLTFPIGWDQPPDSRLIVDEWKVGFSLKDKAREDNIVGRDDIAHLIKKLMDLNDSETKKIRERAEELRVASLKAVGAGGTSYANLDSFLDGIMQGKF